MILNGNDSSTAALYVRANGDRIERLDREWIDQAHVDSSRFQLSSGLKEAFERK